jgi:hypothetical protein
MDGAAETRAQEVFRKGGTGLWPVFPAECGQPASDAVSGAESRAGAGKEREHEPPQAGARGAQGYFKATTSLAE